MGTLPAEVLRWSDLLVTRSYILSLFVFGCSGGYSFITRSVCLSMPLTFLIVVPTPVLAISEVWRSSLALPMSPLILARWPTSTTVSVISQFCWVQLLLVWRLLLGLIPLVLRWLLLYQLRLVLPSSSTTATTATSSSSSSLRPLLSPGMRAGFT